MDKVTTSLFSEWKERFTPFKGWIGELRKPEVLKADLIAGLTVALVLVPQSMAYASLAGLEPYIGLYAAFLPVMVAALFGSSRQLGTGPVAIVSLMTAAALEPLVTSGQVTAIDYAAYAALLALMIGLFQLSLGLLKLGVLVDFLSHPVVVGFTNAAALIIASSQLSKLFGTTSVIEKGEHHYETIWSIIQHIPDLHWPTVFMAIYALGMLVYLKKTLPRAPNVLITVIACTFIAWGVDYGAQGGKITGDIPEGLPSLGLPAFDIGIMSDLLIPAIMIALIGFVESISVAKAIASQTRQRISANQELVGQGLSNITSSLFHGYPVSGGFSRSAVNFAAGAMTGFASIVTAAIIGITLLFLTPLLYHLPQATLAAVIMVAVLGLIKIEPIKHAWKVQPHDGIVGIITFVATLIVAPHLEYGILIGVLLSLGLYLYRSMSPRFAEMSRHTDGTLRDADVFGLKTSDDIAVYRYDGDLYFANSGYLEGKILNHIATKPNIQAVVLDLEAVDQIDATGEEMLEKLHQRLEASGIILLIARTKKQVLEALERSGFINKFGTTHLFRQRTDAIKYAQNKLQKEGKNIDVSPLLHT